MAPGQHGALPTLAPCQLTEALTASARFAQRGAANPTRSAPLPSALLLHREEPVTRSPIGGRSRPSFPFLAPAHGTASLPRWRHSAALSPPVLVARGSSGTIVAPFDAHRPRADDRQPCRRTHGAADGIERRGVAAAAAPGVAPSD